MFNENSQKKIQIFISHPYFDLNLISIILTFIVLKFCNNIKYLSVITKKYNFGLTNY